MVNNSCEKDDHSCANSADGESGEKDSSELKGEDKQAPPVTSTEEKKKGGGAVQVVDTGKDDAHVGEVTPHGKSKGVPKEKPSSVAGEKTDETQNGKESGQSKGQSTGAQIGSSTDIPTDEVCVKRIINVEITEEIKSFLKTFTKSRDHIVDWCYKNKELYSSKINDKTTNLFFQKTKNIHLLLNQESIDIDTLNILLYFYNLYCTHNNMEKINAHSVMCTSYITYRGIYENINQNSKSFKNLLKEEKAYNKLIGKTNNLNDFFSNYKKTYPYGINLILGIFLTFLSGYYGSLLLGFTKFTTRLICGIVFSYVTLILEVIIFIIINEKVENLKRSQKSAGSNYGLYEKVYFKKEPGGKGEVDNAVGEEAELVTQGEIQEMKEVSDKHPTLKQRRKV
ncbi:Uncharacterized protein PCOAH_00048840 [Plasmodium coatneyi]|uniref:Uncharacterized protein n=1 Tax=Plasmodium coatneyi TaxID=208452 RepID=A0A1B1E641_9APIC|nr:Uncharacterized protein PCOAH_00048840 [Plasmodium coatneyi]ANQ10481.1 Uncharacterized protein PCOAH_00048840 [Plasmodium coatneyi]